MTNTKQTILTGIRVNGEMTLGNHLGALLPMVRLANKHSVNSNINIFVPDLHTIISDIDGTLQANLIKSIKYYLAAGLKLNQNVHIYRQSYIPAHSELAWILNCFATMGEVSRMIQYKEKGEGKDSTNVGIFDYPVLMAADILLYDARYVPVGEDQFQHLELTRDLAERFNHRAGREVFVLPAPTAEQAKFMGANDGIRIRDLQNPERKMSKSAAAENSKIMLSDTPEAAAKKVMSATTDSVNKVQFDMSNQPGISNLLQILSLLQGIPLATVTAEWAGVTQYGEFKAAVAEEVKAFLADFQARVAEISDREVLDILEESEAEVSKIAQAKLLEVQKVVGLR
ncbi:MAG: tryptophan--tRNA ligase [Candidatus Nomurabacteria bacterium]|nr:tryptophan--tRNA ligase [Candidatus Nomurabacteria bacterium]